MCFPDPPKAPKTPPGVVKKAQVETEAKRRAVRDISAAQGVNLLNTRIAERREGRRKTVLG